MIESIQLKQGASSSLFFCHQPVIRRDGLFDETDFGAKANARFLNYPSPDDTELSVNLHAIVAGSFGEAAAFHHFAYGRQVFDAR